MICDERMDNECVALCNTLNSLPGIQTFESCCGHGKNNYRIWFRADNINDLCIPTMGCNRNYCGHIGWHIEINHVECPNKTVFLMEGPIGSESYSAIDDIITTINSFVIDNNRIKQEAQK